MEKIDREEREEQALALFEKTCNAKSAKGAKTIPKRGSRE